MQNLGYLDSCISAPPWHSNTSQYTFHVFWFKSEPMAIWRSIEGDDPVEFIEGVGWSADSDFEDFMSDIGSCVTCINANYDELPFRVLESLKGWLCST